MAELNCQYLKWANKANENEEDEEFKIELDTCDATSCYLCHAKFCYHDLKACSSCNQNTCENCYEDLSDHIECYICKTCEETPNCKVVEGSYLSNIVKALTGKS